MQKTYDVIVIGARCAGSPAAMLLARKGYKVLLLDKAGFPSDTISTHIMFPTGVARLKRWGLLDRVLESNCPFIRKMGFDTGAFSLMGLPPMEEDAPGIIAPRRKVLDNILAAAAVEAGAELRENCLVEEVVVNDGMVTGIRCHTRNGAPVTEKARLVIGADGRNSIVAKAVKAEEYIRRPALTCWYYTYWSGVEVQDLVFYSRPDCVFGTIPTNDGLTCIPVAVKASELRRFRSDIEGNYLKTLDYAEELAGRVRQGKREARFSGMADLPNFFRKPYGPGWALAGDAAYHRDPITAQGISDAFRSADSLAEAIDAGFSGKLPMEQALMRFEQNRNEELMPMFELTCEWAKLEPPTPEMEYLLSALRSNQAEADRYFGTIAGTVPIPEFFSPGNLQQITGAVQQ